MTLSRLNRYGPPLLVIAATCATLAVNYLANALPIAGRTTGAVSDGFDVLFKPAGFTFAVWGVIYLGLLLYTGYQAIPSPARRTMLDRVALPYACSSLANMGWLILWHHERFYATVAVMLGLLSSLVWLYVRIDAVRGRLPRSARLLVGIPFGLYLAWICVATAANVTIALSYAGYSGWPLSEAAWAVLVAGVLSIVAFLVAWPRRDVSFLGVVAWGFWGISQASGQAPFVSRSTALLSVVFVVTALLALGNTVRRSKGSTHRMPVD